MQLGIAQTFGKHRLFALQLLYRQLCLKLYTIFCVCFLICLPFVLWSDLLVLCLSMRHLCVIMSDNRRLKGKLFCKKNISNMESDYFSNTINGINISSSVKLPCIVNHFSSVKYIVRLSVAIAK